ncbi:hypothetical protein PGT21_001201 [Puccinia graminis f. sp. tritici]|nr:hypothetical protein PGT21_001201 [Puccinia graminis f. sp. tritici]
MCLNQLTTMKHHLGGILLKSIHNAHHPGRTNPVHNGTDTTIFQSIACFTRVGWKCYLNSFLGTSGQPSQGVAPQLNPCCPSSHPFPIPLSAPSDMDLYTLHRSGHADVDIHPRLHATYIGSSFDYSQQDTSSQIDWNRGRNQEDSTRAVQSTIKINTVRGTSKLSRHQEFHSRTLSILSTYSPSSVFVQCHPLLITNSYFIHNSLKSATRQ